MSFVGVRVVRGPTWKWGSQDGGEGNLGTVCKEDPNSSNTVIVKWDAGRYNNYRAGKNGLYDLRIFDNSYFGVMHMNECKGCQKQKIIGLKYKCSICVCFDLCASCYHGDKHDKNHTFLLFETNTEVGINLPTRRSSKTARLASGSKTKYYCDHLPVLGKGYKQTNTLRGHRTVTENNKEIENLLREQPNRCVRCDKLSSKNIKFEPCNHEIACVDCCKMVNNCILCRVPIKKRILADGSVLLNFEENVYSKLEELLYNLEEKYGCVVCANNRADKLFDCGHTICSECAPKLTTCHMCRKPIDVKLITGVRLL